jgi:hypothetical protein
MATPLGTKARGSGVFQTTVMMVATVFLIVALIIIGIGLWRATHGAVFPPVQAECPDYWLDFSKGDGSVCTNVKGLGSSACPVVMDFSSPAYEGEAGLCSKVKWARNCDLTWDGITNNSKADSC